MSQPSGEPTGPAAPPQSAWQRGQQVAADLPEGTGVFGAAKAGWQAGRAEVTASQSAPTHYGPVIDASTHGTWDNGDGGAEPASAESLDELHSKVDALQGSVSGMASSAQGGGVQQGNSNLQQLGAGLRLPERPPALDPLAASAAQRQRAGEQQAQSAQLLQGQRARNSAINAQRQQASSAGIAPPRTTNGMSDSFAQTSFYGTQGSGIGTAPSTWESARWQSGR
jgi:hypothetical protein